jgi:hypothetical protein
MPAPSPGCLTTRHLTLFGAIVQWFARHEVLMDDVMSKVSGASRADIMLLSRRLDFGARREAMLDLLRHHGIPMDQLDRLCAYLVVPYTHMPLRHDIAHSVWRHGKQAESIQPNWILNLPPTITPVTDDPDRTGERRITRDDSELTYSIQDLVDIEDILAENHRAMRVFLAEAGLLPADDVAPQDAHHRTGQ